MHQGTVRLLEKPASAQLDPDGEVAASWVSGPGQASRGRDVLCAQPLKVGVWGVPPLRARRHRTDGWPVREGQ